MGNNILAARKRLGFSQEFVARAVHVSVRTYRAWEQGMWDPTDVQVLMLSHVLDSSPEYLCGRRSVEREEEIARARQVMDLLECLTPDGQRRAIAYLQDIKGNPKLCRKTPHRAPERPMGQPLERAHGASA